MPRRYSIVLLTLAINMLCYTDRACVSVAAPKIREEFGFNATQMGLVFGIFSLSYFLGQTPWGALADRIGARWLVTGAILGWSLFTGLTAAAWGLGSLLAIRFVFGALEAALSPAVASAFNRWIPPAERSSAFGFYLGGGRLGAAITPAIATLIMARYDWRAMFLAFGAIGVIGAIAWHVLYRDKPLEAAPDKDSVVVKPLDQARLLSLLGVAFGCTFLWQFFITWFPTYLREARHLDDKAIAVYAGLPFLFGLCAASLGGLLTDFLGTRLGPSAARRIIGFIALTASGAFLSAGIWCSDARLAAMLMACAAASVDLLMGAAWASALDIGGAKGGMAAGLMNAASNFAGFVSPTFNGWVIEQFHDWNIFLSIAIGFSLVSAVLWLRVNPRRTEVS